MTSLKSFCVAMLLSAAVLPSSDAVRDVAMYINGDFTEDSTICADLTYMYGTIGVKNAILAFYSDAAHDAALMWENNDDHAACVTVPTGSLFSLNYGSDPEATWKGVPAAEFGTAMDTYLPTNGYSGLDITPDLLTKGCDATEIDQLVALTKSLTATGITVTHSPTASYFSNTGSGYCGTADSKSYFDVETGAGTAISKYYVLYYGVAAYTYDTYDLVFTAAGDGVAVGSAVCEIDTASPGLGAKIVVGKTLTTGDGAGTGFVDTADLNALICTAETTLGYTNGLMFYRYNGPTDALYTDITKSCLVDGATFDCTPSTDDGSSSSTTSTASTTGAIGTMTVSVLAVVSVGMMALL